MHRKILVKEFSPKSVNTVTESPVIFNSIINEFHFSFPYYYKFYYNALFCLLLSPNWISFKENSVSIQQSLPQKILCIGMNILLCIYGLMSLRNNFATKVKEHPEMVFSLFSALLWTMYALTMVYTLWLKGKRIKGMMDVPKKPSNFKIWITGFALLILSILLLLFSFFSYFGDDQGRFWKKFGTRTLYMFYVSNNLTNQTSAEIDANTPLITFGIILQVFVVYQMILFEMCAFISSIAAFEIATSSVRFYKENKGISLQIILQRYALAKKSIRKINHVNGIILLLNYISMISFTSDTLVDLLDERSLGGIITCGQFYIVNISTLVLAGEAHLTMSYLEEKICQKAMKECDYKTVRDVKTFFKTCPGDCGLTGQKFFTVSYSLLGATTGIFLTFVLVMIQLKDASKTNGSQLDLTLKH